MNFENFMKTNGMVDNGEQPKEYEIVEEQVPERKECKFYLELDNSVAINNTLQYLQVNNINFHSTSNPIDFVASNIVDSYVNADEEMQPLFKQLSIDRQAKLYDEIRDEITDAISNKNIDGCVKDRLNILTEGNK